MSYTVLARKYRSQTFDEVIGQNAVTTTLSNAITSSRVHHGYLFCGTRGTGKTSMARILAKCLNCLAAGEPTLRPCGQCDSCRGIAAGDDMDVIEIDAASHTGVDNIRELRGNSVFRPARSRFKIYIIDEVHMLSPGAFNALLKTLEEPPSHVKFIFATTDPQKVPATIQSRCQRFDFRPIPADQIAERLTFICKEEGIQADPAALKRVARLGNGSLRDSISLLDQVLSVCGTTLTGEAVDEFLPATHDELLAALIEKLADSDPAAAIQAADRSLGQGQTAEQWCTALIGQLRDLMVMRVCGPETELVDAPAAVRPRLAEQSQRFEAPAYVFMISVLEELRRAVKYSGSSRALIEAALVRLADTSKFASIESLLAKLDGAGSDAAMQATPAAAPRGTGIPAREASPAGQVPRGTGIPDRDAPSSAAPTPRGTGIPARDSAPSRTVPPRTVDPAPDAPPVSRSMPAESAAAKKKEPAVAAPAASIPASSPRIVSPGPSTTGSAQAPAGRPRSEDLRAAMSEPAVREAIEIFEGQLVNVKRTAPAPRSEGTG